MREDIRKFAEAMENVMSINDEEKGDSWKEPGPEMDKFLKDEKLWEEFKEVVQSENPKELVDLANICMMLWNRADMK